MCARRVASTARQAGGSRVDAGARPSLAAVVGAAALLGGAAVRLAGLLCVHRHRPGAVTLANFAALVTDPEPRRAAPDDADRSPSASRWPRDRRHAARLAGRAHRHAGAPHVRVLMTASFVTPPFLGAIAWEILAAPNSGILNRLWRDLDRRAGRPPVRHLLADRAHLRHRLLHVPLRVRAGRQRARPHPGRAGGRLRHPRRAAVAHRAT